MKAVIMHLGAGSLRGRIPDRGYRRLEQTLVFIILAASATIILHHYEPSPFFEKRRLMFG
jgi:hypothetical protein